MIVKDTKGMYEVKVDVENRIVYDTPTGLWKKEDMARFQNDFANKIFPLLKGKSWAKCSDLRNYKTSNIVEETNAHLSACVANGFIGGAMIVDSAVVKMQMNRASKDTGLKIGPMAFTDEAEAKAWLKAQQF